ncbi:MAG: glycosyltransferase [Myxococcota bacterium]|nr:glycosyltransferase [Myxococcota bacterium]
MFRILFSERAPAIGGSNFSLLQLVLGLDRSRFSPFVLFKFNLSVRKKYEEAGIPNALWSDIIGQGGGKTPSPETWETPVPRYKENRFYRLLWSMKMYAQLQYRDAELLAPWLKREGFSLVHANNFVWVNAPSLTAARLASIPAVSHQRGFYDLNPFQRYVSRRVDRFICVSQAVARHYVGQGLPERKVMAIYNGIDLDRVKPPTEKSTGDKDTVKIGYFGRLEKWKGVSSLLEAARIVLARHAGVTFVLAGTGPEEAPLQNMVEQDPVLRQGVQFLGFCDNPLALMGECDLTVNCSIEPEPLSRSALESLARGVPVVASDSGGNPEIVVNGENGFLYPTGDAAGLAAALEKLIADQDLRHRCARGARARAETHFGARQYVENVAQVYTEILEEKART